MLFSSVGEFMKSSFGLLNADDKAEIRAQVFILRKQQIEEIHQMEDLKNNSAWIFGKVADTIENVNRIKGENRKKIKSFVKYHNRIRF